MRDNFYIEPFSKQNDVKNFGMGSSQLLPLKSFLQNQALDFQNSLIAQTYVVVAESDRNKDVRKVVGYITLTCSEIDLQDSYDVKDCPNANKYEVLPAVKIARLAVDKNYRGYGIGKMLMQFVVLLCLDVIVEQVGCRFLITDAKNDAISFYKRCGFTLLDTEDNNNSEHPIMFVDLKKLRT
jgi:ribosomal protein S18 acetylase RimI-like enzyme